MHACVLRPQCSPCILDTWEPKHFPIGYEDPYGVTLRAFISSAHRIHRSAREPDSEHNHLHKQLSSIDLISTISHPYDIFLRQSGF